MINGKIHYKWSFSIAMLNYQRVPTICLSKSSPVDFCEASAHCRPQRLPWSIDGSDLQLVFFADGADTWDGELCEAL